MRYPPDATLVEVEPTSRTCSRSKVRESAGIAIALALPVVSVLVVLETAYVARNTFWGDPTIYFVFARNVAVGHPFQFNPGQFSSGVSSVLWELVLAVPFVIGAGVAGAKVWSATFGLVAVLTGLMVAWRVSRSLIAAGLATLLLAGVVAFYAAVGYDSGMTLTLITLTVPIGQQVHDSAGRRSILALGLLWALLPLARPDTTALVILQLGALAIPASRSRRLLLFTSAAVASVPSLLYYGYSQLVLGTYSVSNATRTLDEQQLASRLGPILFSSQAIGYLLGIALVLALAAVGLRVLWSDKRRRWVATYGATSIAIYGFVLMFYPVTIYMDRYFLPAVPFVVVGVAAALAEVLLNRTARAPGVILACGLFLPSLAGPLALAVQQSQLGYTFDAITERDVVAQVNVLAPRGATVLGYEVQDRFGLRPDLRYLAVNGLTDGLITRYREHGTVALFLERYRPLFWIADDPPAGQEYTAGTVLKEAVSRFEADSTLSSVTLDGIRFHVVARRLRSDTQSLSWRYLVRLSYGVAG